MAKIMVRCKSCGAQIQVDDTQETGFCPQCDTAYITGNLLRPAAAPRRTQAAPVGGGLNEETLQELETLLRAGEPLLAIKLVREQTGWGLKEAKDYVDNYRVRPSSPKTAPQRSQSSAAGCLPMLIILLAALAVLIGALAPLPAEPFLRSLCHELQQG